MEKLLKLTKLQIEVLAALRGGLLLTIDKQNLSWLGERSISPQTRYFMTENRLITRHDPTRAVETAGNGFTISAKGQKVLLENEHVR